VTGATSYSGMDATTATVDVGGAKIPVLGFGTYGMSGPRLQDVLVAALQGGFRHIDTAQMYQNEADVGVAIRASGVPRDAIFVTTKVGRQLHPAAVHGLGGRESAQVADQPH
jgi:2,5-diketo-D-gluconate reductase B